MPSKLKFSLKVFKAPPSTKLLSFIFKKLFGKLDSGKDIILILFSRLLIEIFLLSTLKFEVEGSNE